MTGQQQPDIQWYIARDGKQHGPLSDVEMRTFVGQGHLKPTDLIWRPGFADWRPAPAVFPFQAPEAPARKTERSNGAAQRRTRPGALSRGGGAVLRAQSHSRCTRHSLRRTLQEGPYRSSASSCWRS